VLVRDIRPPRSQFFRPLSLVIGNPSPATDSLTFSSSLSQEREFSFFFEPNVPPLPPRYPKSLRALRSACPPPQKIVSKVRRYLFFLQLAPPEVQNGPTSRLFSLWTERSFHQICPSISVLRISVGSFFETFPRPRDYSPHILPPNPHTPPIFSPVFIEGSSTLPSILVLIKTGRRVCLRTLR